MRAFTFFVALVALALTCTLVAAGGGGRGRGGGGGRPRPPSSSKVCLKSVDKAIRAVERRFSHKICDIRRIRRDISRACKKQICRGLNPGKCRQKLIWELKESIFPKFCKDRGCKPLHCPEGKEFNKKTCKCELAPDCRENEDCTGGPCDMGVCSTGLCSIKSVPDCCINDADGEATDTKCTDDSPLCGSNGGETIPSDDVGTTCYVCENDETTGTDTGCDAATPVCVAPENKLGNMCVPCINDEETAVDSGCSMTQPFCDAATDEAGTDCVECIGPSDCPSGNACMTATCENNICGMSTADDCCINSDGGAATDEGCSGTGGQVLCGAADGSTIPMDTAGDQCFLCENNSFGSASSETDLGCDDTNPFCDADESKLGTSCGPCVNSQLDGSIDVGCNEDTPLCRQDDGSEVAPGGVGESCQECGVSREIAVCFAIDESGSICSNGAVCSAYEDDSLGFAETLINDLSGLTDMAEFGIVTFAGTARDKTTLTTRSGALSVLGMLAEEYTGGLTNTEAAFMNCGQILEATDKPKLLVLLTDGNPTTGGDPDDDAETLKDNNVVVISVGVGSGIDQGNLDKWASPGLSFSATNFDQLDAIAAQIANTPICIG